MRTQPQQTSLVFRLYGYGGQRNDFVVIVNEPTPVEKVQAAWSYAVRYTAKGLDLPDHDAAIELFRQRHPSWTLIQSQVLDVGINLTLSEQDVPENS